MLSARLSRAGVIALVSVTMAVSGCGSGSSNGKADGGANRVTDTAKPGSNGGSPGGGSDGGKLTYSGSESGAITFDSVACSLDTKGDMMAVNGNLNGNLAVGILPGDSDTTVTISTDAATTNQDTFTNLGTSDKGLDIIHSGDAWKVDFDDFEAVGATTNGKITVDGTMNCTKVDKLPG